MSQEEVNSSEKLDSYMEQLQNFKKDFKAGDVKGVYELLMQDSVIKELVMEDKKGLTSVLNPSFLNYVANTYKGIFAKEVGGRYIEIVVGDWYKAMPIGTVDTLTLSSVATPEIKRNMSLLTEGLETFPTTGKVNMFEENKEELTRVRKLIEGEERLLKGYEANYIERKEENLAYVGVVEEKKVFGKGLKNQETIDKKEKSLKGLQRTEELIQEVKESIEELELQVETLEATLKESHLTAVETILLESSVKELIEKEGIDGVEEDLSELVTSLLSGYLGSITSKEGK